MSEEMKDTITPVLTLEPLDDSTLEATWLETVPGAPVVVAEEEQKLTPEEQKVVDEFAAKIELSNSNMVLQYGVGAQKKIAEFSESALNNVRTKDLGEVGELLTGVVGELRSFGEGQEEKGFLGIFKKTGNKLANMKTKYNKAEANVNKICEVLEGHQLQLLKDVALLDKMYDMNKAYLKELCMYILAGKQKLSQVQAIELPKLEEKAKASGLPEDAQAANDLAALCSRFEKKLHDLELTRMVSIQMAPQIRLVQNNDTMMCDKIQSTLVNTIPLWKSQMVLALGIANSQEAIKSQQAVSQMTNDLLKKNAAALKMATIETAKESERGIVDMETLEATNRSLIETLDEVAKIQAEGREKRAQAEVQLGRIEGELKQKLLDIRK